MEPAHKTLTLTVPNGVLKKHHQQLPQQQVRVVVSVYRECLKNHAASLGGHALDGCGEFMASPSSNPSDPTSLTCAACGCHRNFHRRLPLQIHNPTPLSSEKQHHDEEEDDDEEQDQDQDQDQDEDHLHNIDEEANEGETGENSSAPHMLLALSAGVSTHPQPQPQPQGDHIHMRIIEELQQQKQQQQNGNGSNSMMSRKRFRSKFSPEQKERMQDLSERLGWKMQKRDEGLIEDRCREIGIDKGVFKVWMHNNKHNFLHSINSSSSRHPNNNNFTTTAVPTDGGVTPDTAAAAPMSNGNGCNIAGMKINGSDSDVS